MLVKKFGLTLCNLAVLLHADELENDEILTDGLKEVNLLIASIYF